MSNHRAPTKPGFAPCSRRVPFIREPKHRVRQPALEGLVVLQLLEELRVVLHERHDHPFQGLVVPDASVLLVGVLARILGLVGSYPVRYVAVKLTQITLKEEYL